jgi:beta-ureidopropionase / N-carbamoyl-L-amino-acid hydrolase
MLTQTVHAPSLSFSPEIRMTLSRVGSELGIAHREIDSAAGHHTRQLPHVCPTGMVFVPCRDGISHIRPSGPNPPISRPARRC